MTVEPLKRAAERRRQQRDQPGVLLRAPEALQRDRARRARAHGSGYLRSDLGVEVAGGDRRRPSRRPPPSARASSRVSASTVARAALECAMPGMPWCGDSVTLTIVPAPARAANASS